MELDATVVWKRVVPASLLRVAQGGVGLCLVNPPEGYYQFLADAVHVQHPRPAPKPIVAPAVQPKSSPQRAGPVIAQGGGAAESAEVSVRTESHKVRVSHGLRTRVVTVTATSEARAHEIALERVGEGWKVIGS